MSRAAVAPWVATVLRLVLAAVLGVAGAIKLPDPDASVRAVRAYQLVPEWAAQALGFGLPVLEVALAVLLLLGLGTRLAAVAGAVLMAAFTIGVASAWARGLSIDCGCFGGGGEIAAEQTRYPQEIARDVALLAAAGWLAWRPTSRLSLDAVLFPNRPAGDDPADTGAGTPARSQGADR